ncbi:MULTISPECIES: hypothetical protein [unclassified Alteromonas]|uniref:hypothetical protein n=1 Tax=unclassified Alteromonas TaxID=2614992 RepID=UPI000A8B08B0|nr:MULTISPECIES: hypothetical protein [unclassified Alteromonas]
MALQSYITKAFATLIDEHSTMSSKTIARQVLQNSGLSEDDIKICIERKTLSYTYIFEA